MERTPLTADFVHLHVHSHYSLLNAIPTPDELAKRAKENGMPAIGLTDNGGLYGAVDFYKACAKQGVKPILGVDAYLAPRTRFDREANIDKPRGRVVLLAKNNDGYVRLIKLVTESYVNGFYYRPRIDHALMEEFHKDVVCIIPSFSGETTLALKDGDTEKAGALLDWYKSLYGNDCYLEVTHHPEIHEHEALQKSIISFAEETNTPLVAQQDVYYLEPGDHLARETMIKIQSGGIVDTSTDGGELAPNFSFTTVDAMMQNFSHIPDALKNSVHIAEECTVTMDPGKTWYFPDYTIESGKEPDDELHDKAYAGVLWRGLSLDDAEVKERLDYELSVIKMKGYAKYFLVVGDLLREARERKILTTIRGSVAGSLTTYVLGITNVNPLEYNLPFERFLNPERPSAPDVDMDYADNRRDEIIEYARSKYGKDNVAQIGTFGTMMARAAVRDVARALGHPYATGDRIAKLIPMGSQGFPMTIEKAIEIEPELATLYKKDREAKEVIDLAKQIEGRARHVGVHAAGVVIAPRPLTEFVPVQPDPKSGKLITQYDMHSVGEDGVGLLKFDFLGIKNLAILAEAVRRVRVIHKIEVDIENIPLNDKKTFEMLARGETMGLFQLNGSGMTAFLKQLRPSSIHDINAMVALYRPGPMESIPQYIERKHNPNLVTYLDPRLRTILDRSYGVITYQDDVMMISIELAGYSWLDADKLRKAMGKKIPEVMEAEKDKLLKGFREYGKLSLTVSDKLWKLIEPFAAYGFNKAHAASYGRVAYQTAYMKANYPVEYMSAVLTADAGDTEKVSEIIRECERMGIPVLPPDINESYAPFSVVPAHDGEDAKIRFGLTTIKNFGESIAEEIVEERKAHGPFVSVADFLTRVIGKNLNKKSLEALVLTGCFDRFEDRSLLLHNLDTLLAFHKEASHGKEASQDSLFGGMSDSSVHALVLAPVPEGFAAQTLLSEKELLGVYVSGHPLDQFEAEMTKGERVPISYIKQAVELKKEIDVVRMKGKVVTVGMIESVRELLTKKGDRMAFIVLGDKVSTIEMVAFPETYQTYKDVLAQGTCVAIKGKLTIRNDEPSIALDQVKKLEKVAPEA